MQLRRPQMLEEQSAQHVYQAEVQRVAGRVRQVFDEWVATREVETDNARLANAAAVSRWELMRLARDTDSLAPPRAWTGVQRDIQTAVLASARACQLLANGYRSHKSEAVCDGQAMLVESVQYLGDLVANLQLR